MLAIFKTPRSGKTSGHRNSQQDSGSFGNRHPGKQPGPEVAQRLSEPSQPAKSRMPELKPPTSNTTIIGTGLVFKGEVNGEGSVRVEGKFVGTLEIGHEVIIGEGGTIEGNVRSKNVSVLGTLKGNVVALDKITIESSGAMYGDIIAPRVVVTEGAIYKGRIDMEPKTLKAQGGDKASHTQKQSEKKKAEPEPQTEKTPGPPPKA